MNSPNFDDGIRMLAEGRPDEAYRMALDAIGRSPNDPKWHQFAGLASDALGETLQTVNHLAKAIDLEPDNTDTLCNLAAVLADKVDMFVEAENAARRALDIDPKKENAWNVLGKSLELQGRYGEAALAFSSAIDIVPDFAMAHNNLAMNRLARGDFSVGWTEFEWRIALGGEQYKRFRDYPQWNGEVLRDKTIVLAAEQGMGDILQFIRYAPMVAQRVGRVVVECPAAMRDLIATVPGIDDIVCEGEQHPPFDVFAFLLSLPRVFGTQSDSIPADVPYLRVPDGTQATVPAKDGFSVGIAWAGRSGHGNDRRRSMTVEAFAPLFDLSGVQLYSLQVGERSGELAVAGGTDRVADLTNQVRTFSDTAALVSGLDLVITVDTALAHVAGALGRPVWTLLPFTPDWRWRLEGEGCAWYPSMRLFRQAHPGDWDGVMENVTGALMAAVSGR